MQVFLETEPILRITCILDADNKRNRPTTGKLGFQRECHKLISVESIPPTLFRLHTVDNHLTEGVTGKGV